MEIAEDFPEDIVIGENINFVYLKNEISKILNFRLPDTIDQNLFEFMKKIFEKLSQNDQMIKSKEIKLKEFQDELAR
jgi:hypothetical protein